MIGISAYRERASWGVWELPAVLLPDAYVEAVLRSGGLPLLLPPVAGMERVLDRLDGLLLSGGADLDPGLYGQEDHPETQHTRPARDAAELALLHGALARQLPVLGICRGMELLNVGLGGTLDQHLPEHLGHDGHRGEPGVFSQHQVRTEPGSRLRAALGDAATVCSYHHQGVDTVGEGLEVVARSSDGLIEGLEHRIHPFVLGVLWHPEAGEDPPLFEALVAAAHRRPSRVTEVRREPDAVGA